MKEIERRFRSALWRVDSARVWVLSMPYIWLSMTWGYWRVLPACIRYECTKSAREGRPMNYGHLLVSIGYAITSAGDEFLRRETVNAPPGSSAPHNSR